MEDKVVELAELLELPVLSGGDDEGGVATKWLMWGDKRAHGVQVSQNLNGAGDEKTHENYCLKYSQPKCSTHLCPLFFLFYIICSL
jgi:hypothetical protein